MPEFEKLIEIGVKTEEQKQKQKAVAYENQESVVRTYLLLIGRAKRVQILKSFISM